MVILGEELQKRKQYDEAIKIFIRMEEAYPGKGMPLLIGAQLRKGDVAAANSIVLRVITENPKNGIGYLLQSAIHEYLKEWSLAESAIQRGLDFDKENLALLMNLGHLYSAQERYEAAQSVYDTILLTHADFIPALFARGAIYDLLGNKRKAQDIYKQILERNENYAPALNNLAFLTMEVYADNKTALELAIKAFRNAPNEVGIIDTLGYALLKNGRIEQSIAFLEKAKNILPEDAAVRIHLAQAYKAAGRKDDAVANLTVINDTNAQEAQIREAKALLKELN
jgi:tetratricopeptide (TPR) repeat protein